MEKNSRKLHEIIVTAEMKIAIALKDIFLKYIFSFQSCVNIVKQRVSRFSVCNQ